jgi:16S rRNA G966 N2-methylase RsmD
MIKELTNPDVITFIQENLDTDPASLMLKGKNLKDLPVKEIAGQISSRRKAKTKLPEWYSHPELIFPPRENLEQASSEITARFKARGLSGSVIADLTGGSGVDLFYMSEGFEEAHYVEPDETLTEIAGYNFNVLGKTVQIHNRTASEFLKETSQKFDVIYLDPSRRDHAKRKVFSLEEYQPNVRELYDVLLEKADEVIIKTSPMVGIVHTMRQLPDTYLVRVVAVENEVKEVLFHLKKGNKGESQMEAWHLFKDGREENFCFTLEEENAVVPEFSAPLKYVYDANPAIRKSGGFNLIAEKRNLKKLGPQTHLYTSDNLQTDFPGRVFEVIEILKPNKKSIRNKFPGRKVNVIAKNFPMKPNEIKHKFQLKDGGEEFLIFCETQRSGKIAMICKRVG